VAEGTTTKGRGDVLRTVSGEKREVGLRKPPRMVVVERETASRVCGRDKEIHPEVKSRHGLVNGRLLRGRRRRLVFLTKRRQVSGKNQDTGEEVKYRNNLEKALSLTTFWKRGGKKSRRLTRKCNGHHE